MQVVKTVEEVRAARWTDPYLTWGLVPTMGTLHEGHLSLVRRARAENDRVAVSVFVNPIQFNRREDLDAYPRQLDHDLGLLEAEGVDLVWAPDEDQMYPSGFQTYVSVEEITQPLEGASRPGHFRGVTTVVAKLFNVIEPKHAYFGQKDAQQVAVIKQMVRDLGFNLAVVVCPIVREPDGLALSSRNLLLSLDERQAGLVLSRALNAARDEWMGGQRDAEHLRATMRAIVEAEPLARIDYISAADPITLRELEGSTDHALLSMAVFVGSVRLIDNLIVGYGEADLRA
ncbi:pantoate--beta-alanine ligase [Aggregatilinea lenta]|uniref:pantoate--beta-alanine ligase n=1 Tax=Aggregatilinea lenta TaxID=913108 RepID=UPI000E5B411C|nr:pantoate--beta-alanine ligase [Aggregatilinea lenta]